ncbi:aminotransferase class III-fold pyridoxal phosphate-dependent enzyme [Flavobacterium sp. ZB4P23]|uniref:aspartate aminotransferase family protein n=1 Tax=unclassified Flavobacterium TaxID=196869 RepID=UPI000F83A9D2|nr:MULTISPECIES: aminotransferase class III-fold pyridoxal phosphate-dependent enzyme [unclassified Flavobacterium]RTY68186.1 aminotransferase class III-fold pyridoxal phosphate-dependent enzyme [Flavobacterium sp. LB2P53]RTY82285.1 aminotransferase class III-fold pyridoxal phosphate-dependent enzyme [Flavobacterium sp. ZB4P23]
MNNTDKLYERRKKSVPNALGIFNPSSIQSAKGAIIIDADGRELIDFAGGIGVNNAGHGVPEIIDAIQKQAEKFIHASFNVSVYEQYLDLTEKLCEILPHGEATKAMLTLSGAESVENAIKIARAVTGKAGIICYDGSFHGRTMMAMTLTSNVKYKEGAGPYAPEVYRLEYPYYKPSMNKRMSKAEFDDLMIMKLHKTFSTTVSVSQTAAIILELVQGEGGFTVASKKYVQYLRKFCTENNILLIFDEVQSGFGRTGKWASYEHYGVTPDLSTWAKSMGGGMPIGAVIGKQEIMDAVEPGLIGGTYLGNPLSCVASLASINYMQKNNINAAGEKVGKLVLEKFIQWQTLYPQNITDVRGLGAMLAIEFSNPTTGMSDGVSTKAIVDKCLEKGLIVITSGAYGNCIRILSPLFIEDEILEKGLSILEETIKEILS